MTREFVEQQGFRKPVWLSRRAGVLIFREAHETASEGEREAAALMDRLGCVVAHNGDGVYFDVPGRPVWAG